MASARAERRSVDAYEHVLGVLGDVTKRSEAVANVHSPTPEDLAHLHVRQSSAPLRPLTSGLGPVPPAQVRLEPPILPGHPRHNLVFGEQHASLFAEALHSGEVPGAIENPPRTEDLGFARDPASAGNNYNGAPGPADISGLTNADLDVADAQHVKSERRRKAPADRIARRAATGAVAAVALGALAVGGWQLAASQSGHVASLSNNGQASHSHGASVTGNPQSNPILPPSIEPLSSSDAVVSYSVPYSTYSITFQTTGECWIGVTPSSGPDGTYSAMKTVPPNGTWNYQANGAVVVRIGAPDVLTIEINGEAVALPAGRLNPYNITLTPSPSASA